jgi:hypothetical protein
MNTQNVSIRFGGRIYLSIAVLLFSMLIFNVTVNASVPSAKTNKANSTQMEDPYHTAIRHAEFAVQAKDLEMIQMHLHHVLNCLEGKTGKDFDASYGNPCNGQGALETLKKDSPNWVRTNNCIALAIVAVKLHDEKATRLVAQAVYEILNAGK